MNNLTFATKNYNNHSEFLKSERGTEERPQKKRAERKNRFQKHISKHQGPGEEQPIRESDADDAGVGQCSGRSLFEGIWRPRCPETRQSHKCDGLTGEAGGKGEAGARTHGRCNPSGGVTTQGRLFVLGVLQNGDRWDWGRIRAERMCSTVPEPHKDH